LSQLLEQRRVALKHLLRLLRRWILRYG